VQNGKNSIMKNIKSKIGYTPLVILLDVISVFSVYYLGIFASFSWKDIPLVIWANTSIYAAVTSVFVVIVFSLFKVYKWLTSNLGLSESIKLGIIGACSIVLSFLVMFAFKYSVIRTFRISSYLTGTITFVFLIELTRIMRRLVGMWINGKKKKKLPHKNTLVVGAGAAAKIVIDDSRTNIKSKSQIIVLVDDDVNKIGRTFSGVPIEGPISNIANIVKTHKIDEVIIAIQSLNKTKLQEIIGYLRYSDVQIRRLPILSELGSVNERTILNVDINEILGRDVVVLDNSEISTMLKGQCVLVTGAGGSIGSELVRQIYKAKPATLVLFDIYENGVYDIQQEIRRQIQRDGCKDVNLVTLIGSTYNEVRVEQIISQYKPDYIYHAAAYKHVPLMEESPVEAVRTNVIGTYNVARLADKYHVKKMLLVSTDKAVRPTNAMGATKRFAEMIIQSFAAESKNTKYCAVRFGNVLGSNGSVIPLFTKQIEEGGPVTVTDPNIIRYFMTIPEAVGLILQSSIYADKGEIFILDMGQPVKIIKLAEKMVRQAGYVPYKEMPIIITGLRPGEKLYEETLLDPKTQVKTANAKIFIEESTTAMPIKEDIDFISKAFEVCEKPNDVKQLIKEVVKTYKPELDD
jgi:FlaA1/EpsC-like NDP-sugar epimerase